ncbi:YSIRK-type signal peptide-containing protein, partial [Streptococcus equi]
MKKDKNMKYYLRRSALGLASVSAAFLVATSVEQVEVKAQGQSESSLCVNEEAVKGLEADRKELTELNESLWTRINDLQKELEELKNGSGSKLNEENERLAQEKQLILEDSQRKTQEIIKLESDLKKQIKENKELKTDLQTQKDYIKVLDPENKALKIENQKLS